MDNLNFNNNQGADNLNISPEKKKRGGKIVVFIVVALIIVGIGGYFVFKNFYPSEPKPPTGEVGRCGDNICDEFEEKNSNVCPIDCVGVKTEDGKKMYNCPQYIPPAPSFYENCKNKGGSVKAGEKNDKGCQLPPQCVLPGTSSKKDDETISKDSPFGFVQGSFDTNYKFDPSYKNMLDLGVHWDRPFEGHVNTMWTDIENETTGKGNYDFKKTDAALSNFKKDIYLYFSLPIVNTLYGSTLSASNPDGSPYPTDVTAYKNFVKTIVNRYSDKVKYWMVSQNEFDDMEPAAKNLKAYYDEGFDSTVKYAKAACEAIKEVCSDCRPVLGGSVVPLVSFSKKGDTISTPDGNSRAATSDGIHAKLVPAVKESCKNLVIDYHFWYNSDKKDYKTQRDIIDKIKKIAPDLEIWNTESGTVDGMKDITEFEQARDIVRLYVYALSYGQKKLFWTNTLEYDWTQDDSNAFDFMGLINNPKNKDGLSHKKLSYYTYKKMVEVLEGSDWDNIETIQEKDGGYIYKFLKNGKPIWVAWNDNDTEKQITISGINSSSVKITEAVPNYSSGKDVTNYLTAFSNKIVSAESGKVIIKIKDVPVFVEEN